MNNLQDEILTLASNGYEQGIHDGISAALSAVKHVAAKPYGTFEHVILGLESTLIRMRLDNPSIEERDTSPVLDVPKE